MGLFDAPKYTLMGSSPTRDGIIKLISKFYMGSTIHLEGEDVHNRKGKIEGVRVIEKGKRFRFELIQ